MLMNKITKYSLGALMVAIAGSCSLSTKMDATIDREVEATTQLKETAKFRTKLLTTTWFASKTTSGSAIQAK